MWGCAINNASNKALSGQDVGWRAILAQFLLSALVAGLLLPLDFVYAYSGAVGGGIAVIGNALFARKVFVPYRAQDPGALLARFYAAEIQKIIVIALLFALAIIGFDVLSYATLFGSYLLVQIVPLILLHIKTV
jgi:ATP synthase protein I